MKRKIIKWAGRLLSLFLFLFVILITIVLNPILTYAHKTTFSNFTIYHEKPLDKEFESILNAAIKLLKTSEIYDANLKIDLCLNDGSTYPKIVQSFQSPAFGIGFYNKIVIMGTMNCTENYDALNGYKWNLTQLITHEAIHCFQFNKFGFWKSNPMATYPDWKWEGYNEYVARQSTDQTNLFENIERLNAADSTDKTEWGVMFADSTFVGKDYYRWWILMQYCMDTKKMTYQQVLQDTTQEKNVRQEMLNWYKSQK
ncbi:MAG: hypothetical protein ABI204_01595 [Ginsengibacter sp.]